MLMGYNAGGGGTTSSSQADLPNFVDHAAPGLGYSQTPMAELSQTHGTLPTFEMIEGVQLSGKRQPNYQINKHLQ